MTYFSYILCLLIKSIFRTLEQGEISQKYMHFLYLEEIIYYSGAHVTSRRQSEILLMNYYFSIVIGAYAEVWKLRFWTV